MTLILSHIPFDIFCQLKDKKNYVNSCSFFDLKPFLSKQEIAIRLECDLEYYRHWDTDPVYITVMPDRIWANYCGNIGVNESIKNWSRIPNYLEEAYKHPDKYKEVDSYNMIFKIDDLFKIKEELQKMNFNKTDIYSVRLFNK